MSKRVKRRVKSLIKKERKKKINKITELAIERETNEK